MSFLLLTLARGDNQSLLFSSFSTMLGRSPPTPSTHNNSVNYFSPSRSHLPSMLNSAALTDTSHAAIYSKASASL